MQGQNQNQFQQNFNQPMNNFQQNNNQFQGNMNYNQNMMPQMSPQYQMMMEMKKQQARQIGELLKKQRQLVENIQRREQEKKNENREIILFFNHNYDILPLTFRQDTLICEALSEYIKQTNKQNAKFKFEEQELVLGENSAKSLGDIEGLVNGAEITVTV